MRKPVHDPGIALFDGFEDRVRVVRPTQINLELREELMGDRQIRIEIEGSPKRGLRMIETDLRSRRLVFGHHVMDSTEACPRGRVVRILFDTLQV